MQIQREQQTSKEMTFCDQLLLTYVGDGLVLLHCVCCHLSLIYFTKQPAILK